MRMLDYGVLLVNTNLLNHIIVSDCVVNGVYVCMSCIQTKMQNNRNTVHVTAVDCRFCDLHI